MNPRGTTGSYQNPSTIDIYLIAWWKIRWGNFLKRKKKIYTLEIESVSPLKNLPFSTLQRYAVVFGPSRSSARFWLEVLGKKTWLTQLFKNWLFKKKTGNERISYLFDNLFWCNPEDINKSQFSLLKSYVL